MKIALAIAISIASMNHAVPARTSTAWATEVAALARAHDLDPWLLVAIVQRESRWTPGVVRHEHDGSCSVGLGQINGPCTPVFVRSMQDPSRNLHRVVELLAKLRATCKVACEDLAWVRGYNPGSPSYGPAVVEEVHRHHA